MSQFIEVFSVYDGPMKGVNLEDLQTEAVKKTVGILESKATEVSNNVPMRHDDNEERIRAKCRDRFWFAIENGKETRHITFNRRNMEYTETFSYDEYMRRHYSAEERKSCVFESMFETVCTTYGLIDIWFTINVYRIGAYSYFAVRVDPMYAC